MQFFRLWRKPVHLSTRLLYVKTIKSIRLLSNHPAMHATFTPLDANSSPRSNYRCHLRLTVLFHCLWRTPSERARWLMAPTDRNPTPRWHHRNLRPCRNHPIIFHTSNCRAHIFIACRAYPLFYTTLSSLTPFSRRSLFYVSIAFPTLLASVSPHVFFFLSAPPYCTTFPESHHILSFSHGIHSKPTCYLASRQTRIHSSHVASSRNLRPWRLSITLYLAQAQ